LDTGTLLADPIPANYNLHSLGFTPDGRTVIAGSDVPYMIDLYSQPLQARPFSPPEDAGFDDFLSSQAVSTDGRTLAFGSNGSAITLWDNSGSAPVKLSTLYGHSDDIRALAFSSDGKTLYSASLDMTLDRWDVADGTLIDQPLRGYLANSRARGAFSPNGDRVATSSCRIKGEAQTCADTEINIWETVTGNNLLEFHAPYEIFTLAFSPDGRWLAESSADKPGSNEVEGSVEVHLWDLAANPPSMRTLVQGMDYVIDHLVFSPDGTLLAGLSRSRLSLWDVSNGSARELPTSIKSQNFGSAAFDPTGQLLALGSISGIQLYNLASGQTVGPLMSTLNPAQSASNDRVLFSPDGKTLVGGGPVILWNVDIAAWISQACDIADRNLTEEEWKTYIGDAPYRETCPESP
jgi:WD40 repeat protein